MEHPGPLSARPWAVLLLSTLAVACAKDTRPRVTPPGAPETAKTETLAAGAALLQSQAPLRPMDVHLVGFHAAKDDPSMQMEAHHYCAQVNQDFMQCTLFDGNTETANLIGIEYIISDTLFERLPEAEQKFWHPHNYEILSGTLVAPGIPAAVEHELMNGKMNSYGKTWHVWNSAPYGRTGDRMPVGDAILEWSFNRDGEAQPGLIQTRDQRMSINSMEKRRDRADLVPLAEPQSGVDALKGDFKGPTEPIPGVVDKNTRAPKPGAWDKP